MIPADFVFVKYVRIMVSHLFCHRVLCVQVSLYHHPSYRKIKKHVNQSLCFSLMLKCSEREASQTCKDECLPYMFPILRMSSMISFFQLDTSMCQNHTWKLNRLILLPTCTVPWWSCRSKWVAYNTAFFKFLDVNIVDQ